MDHVYTVWNEGTEIYFRVTNDAEGGFRSTVRKSCESGSDQQEEERKKDEDG